MIWKYVGNPGVVLKGGQAAGLWRGRISGGSITVSAELFEPLSDAQKRLLAELAERQAAARALKLRRFELKA